MGKKLGNPSLCFTMTLRYSTAQDSTANPTIYSTYQLVPLLMDLLTYLLVVSITKENPPTSNSRTHGLLCVSLLYELAQLYWWLTDYLSTLPKWCDSTGC